MFYKEQTHEQRAKRVANGFVGRSPSFRIKRMKSERSELRMEFAGRSPSFRIKRMSNKRSELRMEFVGRERPNVLQSNRTTS